MKFILAILLMFNLIANANSTIKTQEEKDKEEIEKLIKVILITKALYVDDKNLSKIVDKFIKGGVEELDPHSNFLNKEETANFKIDTSGEFGGIGFVITKKDGVLTIVSPISGTPADKAGIKANDIIGKINNQSALDMSLDDAVKLMRGKPGTKIELTIYRKTESKPIILNITRDIIKVTPIEYKKYKNTLYIKINSFTENTTKDLKKVLNKNKYKNIILDLRNNPGGLLSEAISVSDLFLKSGKIVEARYRNEIKEWESENDNIKTEKIPIVIIVNEGTASASEIVSGALQDNKRAIIIGKETFGKGSIQQTIPIGEETLKITIGRYYLPSGRTIQSKGISPDIIVDKVKVPYQEKIISIKEKDLKNHLKSKYENEKIINKTTKKQTNELTEEDIKNDLQLKTSFDIIKTISILKSNNAK